MLEAICNLLRDIYQDAQHERQLVCFDHEIEEAEGKHSTRDAKTSYNNGVMIEAAS